MLKNKLYPCNECGRKVPIRSKGLCGICRHNQRKKEGTLPKYTNSIKKSTLKSGNKRKEERGCLSEFFKKHIEILEKHPYSEESGKLITTPLLMSIAHILPKRKSGGFPSVQCNDNNVIYLTWEEHTRFDYLLDRREYKALEIEFPNSWDKVKEKIINLLEIVTERNKAYLSLTKYLNYELD